MGPAQNLACGPLSESSESQRVSGAEALYNILKGFFFGLIRFVLGMEELTRNPVMGST